MQGTTFLPRKAPKHRTVENGGQKSQVISEYNLHTFSPVGKRFVNVKNSFANNEKINIEIVWKKVTQLKWIRRSAKACFVHFERSDYFYPARIAP